MPTYDYVNESGAEELLAKIKEAAESSGNSITYLASGDLNDLEPGFYIFTGGPGDYENDHVILEGSVISAPFDFYVAGNPFQSFAIVAEADVFGEPGTEGYIGTFYCYNFDLSYMENPSPEGTPFKLNSYCHQVMKEAGKETVDLWYDVTPSGGSSAIVKAHKGDIKDIMETGTYIVSDATDYPEESRNNGQYFVQAYVRQTNPNVTDKMFLLFTFSHYWPMSVQPGSGSTSQVFFGASQGKDQGGQYDIVWSELITANTTPTQSSPGLVPKLPNDETRFLNGKGNWSKLPQAESIQEYSGDIAYIEKMGIYHVTNATDFPPVPDIKECLIFKSSDESYNWISFVDNCVFIGKPRDKPQPVSELEPTALSGVITEAVQPMDYGTISGLLEWDQLVDSQALVMIWTMLMQSLSEPSYDFPTLLPPISAQANQFLNGLGEWSEVPTVTKEAAGLLPKIGNAPDYGGGYQYVFTADSSRSGWTAEVKIPPYEDYVPGQVLVCNLNKLEWRSIYEMVPQFDEITVDEIEEMFDGLS